MALVVVSIAGICFAALCVWLIVRIVNRRELWAKWTLAAVLFVALVMYPLSYPWAFAVLVHHHHSQAAALDQLGFFYAPVGSALHHCAQFVQDWYHAYMYWCLRLTGIPLLK